MFKDWFHKKMLFKRAKSGRLSKAFCSNNSLTLVKTISSFGDGEVCIQGNRILLPMDLDKMYPVVTP